jgi:hypothetical protein
MAMAQSSMQMVCTCATVIGSHSHSPDHSLLRFDPAAGATCAASTAPTVVSSAGVAIGFYGRDTPAKAATIGNGVSVKKSKLGPFAGRGLFADERFGSGNYITEYGGELIDNETAEARRNDPKNYGTHIRTLWHGQLHIDGINVPNANGQGGASFANDSYTMHRAVGRSLYNAEFEIVENSVGVERQFADTVRKPRSARLGPPIAPVRVFLRALRTIDPGEEVYVWYGNDYWKQPNIQKHMQNNCWWVFTHVPSTTSPCLKSFWRCCCR